MHDVVIVGAGPVGLFLACELGLAGCSVLVLEREAGPSPWRAAPLGIRGLYTSSIEAFDRRGLLPELLAASGEQPLPFTGHFGGLPIDPSTMEAGPWRLPGAVPDFLLTSLEAVEAVLARRAVELGVEIRRGIEVDGIAEDDGTVIARAGAGEFPARWLVGCDGGRSAVRKLGGFAFTGTEPRSTGYTVLATLADPEKLAPGQHLSPAGLYIRTPSDGHIRMVEFDGGAHDRSREPTRDHIEAVLRRVSGTDVTVTEVHFASTFTDRAMQATTYRRGRVLLAGDAAHIHPPFGGQGLNTGLGDAVGLGWRLAATVHGHAPARLLDTYTGERHPAGAAVLDWTRAQAAIMGPDAHSRAIRQVVADLLATPAGTALAFGRITGTATRHNLGDGHPLVGRDAPDFRFTDGTRLGDLMRDGRGVALDFTAEGRLKAASADWGDRIRYAAGPVRDGLGLDGVLVRPDGVVAWAGEADAGAFAVAARRWFGDAAGGENACP